MGDIRSVKSWDETMLCVVRKLKQSGDPQVSAVLAAYKLVKDIYEAQEDHTFLQIDKTGHSGNEVLKIPFLRFRVNTACVLAENMNARAEYIIASLVGPAYKLRYLYRNEIESVIGENMFTSMMELLKGVSNLETKKELIIPGIDEAIFSAAIRDLYENLRKKQKNRNSQMTYINQAFKLASTAHEGVFRQSGEPYIVHPLMVASLLADIGMESEVIAAALLHDVVEDNGDYSLEDIERISVRVSRYVDAVTSVEREYEALWEQAKEHGDAVVPLDKDELGRETLNKLVDRAMEDESMVFAICIKAADRLHNLSTIDGMKPEKIRNKLDETTAYYLPIFRKFGVNHFVEAIENQIWRIACVENGHYYAVKEKYEKLTVENALALCETKSVLSNALMSELPLFFDTVLPYHTEILTENLLPYEVYRVVRDVITDYTKIKQFVTKQQVPLQKLIVLVSATGNGSFMDFVNRFIKAFQGVAPRAGRTVIDIALEEIPKTDAHRRLRLDVEDEQHNVVEIYVYMRDDYYLYQYGSNAGITVLQGSADVMEAGDSTITVFSRDNEKYMLPAGASVLDFAFRIHQDLCRYAVKASINGSPSTEGNLLKTLYDGDRVVIGHIRDVDEKEKIITTAKIDWLLHVRSETVRKYIVRWLKQKHRVLDLNQ